MSFLAEPLRMLVFNPKLLDFSSDGPILYAMRQKVTGFPTLLPGLTLAGKTILVTGATSGVGLEAARQLLQLGAILVIGARNLERAESVKQQFVGEMPSASITILELDLESLDSVDMFVEKLLHNSDERRLDMALLNAGAFTRDPRPAVDGWSQLMQVNFRATAYLALRLVPLLIREGRGKAGRLILVSSEGHAWSTYELPQQGEEVLSTFQHGGRGAKMTPDNEYYTAKLFLALFGRALAVRLDRSALTVVTTTPGFCASGFFPDADSIFTRLIYLTSARSLKQGGRLHVHAATCSYTGLSGQYLRDGSPARLSSYAESEEGYALQDRLWNELKNLVALRGNTLSSVLS